MSTAINKLNLRYLGFCGVDDSIDPELLLTLSTQFPFIEWGVLMRPDLEGSPRYPSSGWLNNLVAQNRSHGFQMNLAAHLCGNRCQEVLNGSLEFVRSLNDMGFRRIQVNATGANGVEINTNRLEFYRGNLVQAMSEIQSIEWILQMNTETEALYQPLINPDLKIPNMSILFDASCGKGIPLSDYHAPYSDTSIKCGYAGGISPTNIESVLDKIARVSDGVPVWIDMESSLRIITREINSDVTSGLDSFSINKCFQCIKIVKEKINL